LILLFYCFFSDRETKREDSFGNIIFFQFLDNDGFDLLLADVDLTRGAEILIPVVDILLVFDIACQCYAFRVSEDSLIEILERGRIFGLIAKVESFFELLSFLE
jgi:hypothetical protein